MYVKGVCEGAFELPTLREREGEEEIETLRKRMI